MKTNAAPISLAGCDLGATRHVCAFFNGATFAFSLSGRRGGFATAGSVGGGAAAR
jgi:hypothetical protein